MCADFNYYINRQGIRGLQGIKGDQGDSPIITVESETPNEYILKITNPDGTELLSPNLRGNKININEGTYVRYNTETGELYTSVADGATGELAGVVRLATDADITDMDEKSAVTPSQLADALSKYLTSPDGSVKIVQSENNSLTEITVEATGQDVEQLKTDVKALQTEVTSLQTDVDGKSPKLTQGDNITLTPQDDGTIKISSTGGGTSIDKYVANVSMDSNLDKLTVNSVSSTGATDKEYNLGTKYASKNDNNTFTGTNTFTKDVSVVGLEVKAALNAHSGTIDDLQVPYTLTNSGKIVAVEIEAVGIHDSNNKKYLNETDLDGQTISMVDGKVHVNMDELGNEVNDLSGRVTAAEADITAIQTDITDVTGSVENKQNKLTAGDNITLVDNEDGTTTISASGGSSPTIDLIDGGDASGQPKTENI